MPARCWIFSARLKHFYRRMNPNRQWRDDLLSVAGLEKGTYRQDRDVVDIMIVQQKRARQSKAPHSQ